METGSVSLSENPGRAVVSHSKSAGSETADLSVLYVYRFCGLGGVETSITTKLDAFPKFRIRARALFLEYYGIGAEEIARAHDVVFAPQLSETRRMLREADIVVVVDFPEFLDAIAESGSNAKIVFESHASYPPALERFYGRLDGGAISAVVVPSEFNRELMRRFGISHREIHVISNPVDFRRFRPVDPPPGLAIQPGTPLVLWVGRLEDPKCPLEFLRIGTRLLRQGRPFRFLLVGDTPGYDEAVAELRAEIPPRLRDSFEFRRGVPPSEMPGFYNAARVTGGSFVSTSLNESQPMVLLEAMACGCPVVSSRVGGVPEVVEDGVTGYLYDLGDDITAGLSIAALSDPKSRSAREAMSSRALDFVRIRHDPSVVAARYRETFEAIR